MSLNNEPFHPNIRALLEYGQALADGTPPPAVKAADRLAERLFVIEGVSVGRATFLTFGAELVSLFQRDLRNSDLSGIFLEPDAALMRALASAVIAANAPGVACATAETESGLRVGVELLVTPLAKGVLPGERLLGLIQPLGGEGFLAGEPVVRLRLNAIYPPLAKAPPSRGLRLVVSN